MKKPSLNKKLLIKISKLVWCTGLAIFLIFAFPNIWGALQFLYVSLFAENPPSPALMNDANVSFIKLLGALLISLIGQLLVFAYASVLLGTQEAIDYYHNREKDYVDALSGRIDLAQQVSKLAADIAALKREPQQIQKIHKAISRDIKMLCEVVEMTKDSLPVYYREIPEPKDKGDF